MYLSDTPDSANPEICGNYNTDVIVVATEEDEENKEDKDVKYVASFFTYANIFELQAQHMKTGAYLHGKYFFSKNMVLIDECSRENVLKVVEDLLEEGDFWDVFRRV